MAYNHRITTTAKTCVAILSIGDELICGDGLDTNAQWIAQQLGAIGWSVTEHQTLGDDRSLLAAAIDRLCRRHGAVIMTGGLGPTDDDLTRFALGDVVDRGTALIEDRDAAVHLRGWFSNRPMPPQNMVQVMRPPSARFLDNLSGTAMGLAVEHLGCRIFALPGPPREMRPMLIDSVLPVLPRSTEAASRITDFVHAYGLGESDAAERLGPLTDRLRRPLVGITVSGGVVSAGIRHGGDDPAAVQATAEQVIAAWSPYVFGRGRETLPEAVGALLRGNGLTIATAESCTGGWAAKLLVDCAGSSDYVLGGWVTYSNQMKTTALAVARDLLDIHGAVSAPVAAAMAEGAAAGSGADVALAITGVAGPEGGTPDKPVGTVFIAVHRGETTRGPQTTIGRYRFRGDRNAIRHRSAMTALQMVRLELLETGTPAPLLGAVLGEAATR